MWSICRLRECSHTDQSHGVEWGASNPRSSLPSLLHINPNRTLASGVACIRQDSKRPASLTGLAPAIASLFDFFNLSHLVPFQAPSLVRCSPRVASITRICIYHLTFLFWTAVRGVDVTLARFHVFDETSGVDAITLICYVASSATYAFHLRLANLSASFPVRCNHEYSYVYLVFLFRPN